MRPKSVTVDGGNTPVLIPVDYRADKTSVQAIVDGTVDYTISYTVQNVYSLSDPATDAAWTAIEDMANASSDAAKLVDGSINALLIEVNSGAGSVTVHISQPDL